MARVVNLDAFRARRRAVESPQPSQGCIHLGAAPDRVILRLFNGDEAELSPTRARVWAERLVAMADVAEALGRDERSLLIDPDGGDDAS